MEEVSVLKEVIKEVPQLAVLCIIVWLFLKQMGRFGDVMKELHAEHLKAREMTRDVLIENSKAMRDIVGATFRLLDKIRIHEG